MTEEENEIVLECIVTDNPPSTGNQDPVLVNKVIIAQAAYNYWISGKAGLLYAGDREVEDGFISGYLACLGVLVLLGVVDSDDR